MHPQTHTQTHSRAAQHTHPALRVDGLSKRYADRDVLRAVSFTVTPGRACGFVGANGAGKTTLIRCLLGFTTPTVGTCHIFGHHAGSHAARASIGFCPERPYLYNWLTALETLEMLGALSAIPRHNLRQRALDTLARVGLEPSAKKPLRTFSKGMTQRLLLAQAILHEPPLVVLDEPLSGLDPPGRALVTDVLLDLRARGTTLFFTSHVLTDIERVCDDVIVLAEGTIRYAGDLAALPGKARGCRATFIDITPAAHARLAAAGARFFERGGVITVEFDDTDAAPLVLDIVKANAATLVSLGQRQSGLAVLAGVTATATATPPHDGDPPCAPSM